MAPDEYQKFILDEMLRGTAFPWFHSGTPPWAGRRFHACRYTGEPFRFGYCGGPGRLRGRSVASVAHLFQDGEVSWVPGLNDEIKLVAILAKDSVMDVLEIL